MKTASRTPGIDLAKPLIAVADILAMRVPFGIDVAELHAHALALLRQEAVPGMVADAEHQHAAEFRREFERVVVAVVAAQNPQPAALVWPLAR